MALPVWLPFALQTGSMISSGIGNYLEGRNQEKYYNRVTKMQQEAQRRRRESERKAGMANIFFGLGGRAPMQPVYQEEPEIDPYESSGAGRLWRGLGTGLGYAATAVSAYDTIRNTMISQAQQAGAKAGAAELTNVISDARPAYTNPLSRALPGESVVDPGIMSANFQPVEHFSDVLGNLSAATPDSSGMFSGWFADARKEAFDEGYATSIGTLQRDYQGKLFSAMQNQQSHELSVAQFDALKEYRNETLSISKRQIELQESLQQLKGEQKATAKALAVSEGRRETIQTMHDYINDSQNPFALAREKRYKVDNTLKSLIQDPAVKSVLKFDKNTNMWTVREGAKVNVNSLQFENALKRILRIGSDEAIMRDDMIRLADNMNTFGEGMRLSADNWMHGIMDLVGNESLTDETVQSEFKRLVTNKNFAAMLNVLQTERGVQTDVMKDALGEAVGIALHGYKGTYTLDGELFNSINIIGYNNLDQATAELVSEVEKIYLRDLNPGNAFIAELSEVATNNMRTAVEGTDLGPGKARPSGSPDPFTNAQYEAARDAYGETVLAKRTARGIKHQRDAGLYAQWKLDHPAVAAEAEARGYPLLTKDWPESLKERTRPQTPLNRRGQRIAGQPKFTQAYWDVNKEVWIEGVDHRVDSDVSRELATDWVLTKSWIGNNPLTGARGEAAERARNTLLSFGANESAIKAGLQSYQNAVLDSNYAWGLKQTYPGQQDMYNPAQNYYTPGIGDFSAQEGKARVLGGFGLGPAYDAFSNVASHYTQRSNYLIPDPRGSVQSSRSAEAFLQQQHGRDWQRLQAGQAVGRYTGAGGRYAPVPAFAR